MATLYNREEQKAYRRYLRSNLTFAEQRLWNQLRTRRLYGYRFRRQYSVGSFILDFYCPARRLAIEIDGDSHFPLSTQRYDRVRQRYIERYAITVLRFTNYDVYYDLDRVLEKILAFLVLG